MIPVLLELLSDPDERVRFAVGTVFVNSYGIDPIEPLTAALASKNAVCRAAAAEALGRCSDREAPEATLEALRRGFADPDERVRVASACAFATRGINDADALRVLVAALDYQNVSVVRTALSGLREYRTHTREFLRAHRADGLVGALLRTLRHPHADVRRASAGLLGSCGDASERVAKALTAALGDDDVDVRQESAFAFSDLTEGTPAGIKVPDEVFPLLCEYAERKPGWGYVRATCRALERLNRFPPVVADALARHLSAEAWEDRMAAASLLSRFPGQHRAAVERTLAKGLRDFKGGHPNQSQILDALGRVGLTFPESRKAIRDLKTEYPGTFDEKVDKLLRTNPEPISN